MSTICPKDGKPCIDDVCRGCGICAITGTELWDQCPHCHGVYLAEFGVDCCCVDAAMSEDFYDYDEDPEDRRERR